MMARETILIVDEDAAQAASLARVLEIAGHPTRIATSGAAALARLAEGPSDLLLTAWSLPDMADGDLLRLARVRRGAMPVLLLAGRATIDCALAALREGAEDFVLAPPLPEELLHRIRALFLRRALQSENAQLRSRARGDAPAGPNPAQGREPGAGGTAERHDDRLVERLMNSEIPYEAFERELLVRALRRTRGNQTGAARLLGMTRRTLQYRIQKFSIDTAPMRHS